MNTSEKVSSASPSPTNNNDRSKRHSKKSKMARSRSVSVSSPGPSRTPSRSSRSVSKHRSPRHYQQKSYPKRSRSPREHRRRESPPPPYPRDSYHRGSYHPTEVDRVEEYISICIKNLNENIDLDHLYNSIYTEFKRYQQFTIKIVLNKKSLSLSHSRTERIAFVNFYNHETASAAKRDKNHKVMCGLPMYIEPVYKNYKPGTIPPPPNYSDRRSRSPGRSYPPPPPPSSRRRSRSITPKDLYMKKTRSYPDYDRRSPPRAYPPRHESRYEPPRESRYESRHEPPPPNYYKRDDRGYKRRSPSPVMTSRARTPPPPKPKYDDLAYKLSRSRSRSPKRRTSRPPALMNISVTPGGVTHYFDNDEKDQTRTLFIGNLDADVEKDYLWKQFEKYGKVEEIDVKKSSPSQVPPYLQSNSDYSSSKKTYAFVRYENMDMAKEAKTHLNGKRIGHNEIKIGYGKVQATNCLWIGGLNDKTSKKELEKEIKYILNTNDKSKFDIIYDSPYLFAFVLFYNVKHAEQVRFDLRGKTIPNSEKLRVDYHDPKMFNLIKPIYSPKTSNNRTVKSRSKSRSESPVRTRKVVQSECEPKIQDEPEVDTKSKKSRISSVVSNGNQEPKSGYENIIITKIDNVRRVESLKNRSRSRSSSPQSSKKRRSMTPTQLVKEPEVTQIDANKDDPRMRDHDEGELLDDEPPTKSSVTTENLIPKTYKSIKHLSDFEAYSSWCGQFTLKKNSFPIKFYLLAGNKQLSESLLPSNNRDMNLQINQRIRLDSSKLDDIEKRLNDKDESYYSIYLCVASDLIKGDRVVQTKRSLSNLITYLNQKSAAGVVSLPDDSRTQANLNIFTSTSNLCVKLMKQLLPSIKMDDAMLNIDGECSYLMCILLKSPNANV